jgi:hypothetical protein
MPTTAIVSDAIKTSDKVGFALKKVLIAIYVIYN